MSKFPSGRETFIFLDTEKNPKCVRFKTRLKHPQLYKLCRSVVPRHLLCGSFSLHYQILVSERCTKDDGHSWPDGKSSFNFSPLCFTAPAKTTLIAWKSCRSKPSHVHIRTVVTTCRQLFSSVTPVETISGHFSPSKGLHSSLFSESQQKQNLASFQVTFEEPGAVRQKTAASRALILWLIIYLHVVQCRNTKNDSHQVVTCTDTNHFCCRNSHKGIRIRCKPLLLAEKTKTTFTNQKRGGKEDSVSSEIYAFFYRIRQPRHRNGNGAHKHCNAL